MENNMEIIEPGCENTHNDLQISNPAWADAMSKILKTKKRKGKPLVLSKAKIISIADTKKIKQEKEDAVDSFEVVDNSGQKVAALAIVEKIKDEKPNLENLEPKLPNRIRVCTYYLFKKFLPKVKVIGSIKNYKFIMPII